jgi:diaminohydroxyphosphoribosylaminopyrimidine deaminase/5-amino-6-(5-phosphoribosylamino)uracil reductase
VIIEGGRQTLQTFIDAGLWDEARIFTGKTHFKEGIKAPEVTGRLISETKVDQDHLKVIFND